MSGAPQEKTNARNRDPPPSLFGNGSGLTRCLRCATWLPEQEGRRGIPERRGRRQADTKQEVLQRIHSSSFRLPGQMFGFTQTPRTPAGNRTRCTRAKTKPISPVLATRNRPAKTNRRALPPCERSSRSDRAEQSPEGKAGSELEGGSDGDNAATHACCSRASGCLGNCVGFCGAENLSASRKCFDLLAPQVGLEPTTLRLTAEN